MNSLSRCLKRIPTTLCGAALAAVAAVAVAGCGGDDDKDSKASGNRQVSVPVVKSTDSLPPGGKEVENVNWAVAGDPVKLDPAYAYDYNSTPIVAQMCENLLAFDTKTGELKPNVAESWEQVNPTTYTYDLRSDVKFWDGSPVTAEDVQFSLARIGDPKTEAYASSYYLHVKSVEVTGENQVTVRLKEPDAQWKYVPAMVSMGAIISKKYAEQHSKDLGLPAGGIMCSGPFKFVSWTRNQEIALERNDDWWNGTPKVKRLTFKVIGDESTLIAALNNGSVDGITYQFDGRQAQQLSGNLRLLQSPSSNYFAVYFNTQRKPWDNVKLRQALAYAIDYEGIVDSVYNGFGQRIKSPAPPVLWTFEKPVFESAYDELPDYKLDLKKAKKLMAESGVEGAKGKLMVGTPTDQRVGLIVQQAAKDIGIDLEIQNVPFAKKTAIEYNAGPKDYDLDVQAWLSDTPDPLGILNPEFNSVNVSSNIAAYKNPEVDKYLNAATAGTTDAEIADGIVKAQAIIMEDAPVIPYIASDSLIPLNDRLTGFQTTFFSYWTPWSADLSGTN